MENCDYITVDVHKKHYGIFFENIIYRLFIQKEKP